MISIAVVLLVLGLILLLLGITKNTGFKDDYAEGMAMFFFILGIMHLAAALFTFYAPVPLGSVVNQTTTYSTDYAEFMNDSVECINCTEGCFACTGVLNCSSLTDETNCTACDQCYWWEGACYEEQAAECALSETCEDCPDCEYNPTNETAFCCEHDFNTTITGSVTTEYAYATEAQGDIGGLFFYIWLFGLLFYGAIYGLSYLKRAYEGKIS